MRKSTVSDAALAVVLAAVTMLSHHAGLAAAQQGGAAMDARGLALIGATGLVLAVRRRWPLPVMAAATGLASSYMLLGYPGGMIFISFAVAVYTVARYRPLIISVPASAVALGLLLPHLFLGDEALSGLAYAVGWVVVPLGIGVSVRSRQEVSARARADMIRAHVDEERLRVAQEVHDIVGHGLAAIKMQADIALHVLAKKPEQAEKALDAISRTSSQALEELRATLATVREAGGDAGRTPAPSLARLDELRRRMGEAGLQVHVETSGEPRTLPPVVDLTGYRIVQESLTNVLRHSAAKDVTVAIGYEEHAVRVAVSNPVTGVVRDTGGSGIAGMRHRVLDLGGSFSAGPRDGQFEVAASLPVHVDKP
jgi:signal transduction histidine kinase